MKVNTPDFKNEREEAQWWADNQELLLKKFEEAEKKGLLGRGRVARQGNNLNSNN